MSRKLAAARQQSQIKPEKEFQMQISATSGNVPELESGCEDLIQEIMEEDDHDGAPNSKVLKKNRKSCRSDGSCRNYGTRKH